MNKWIDIINHQLLKQMAHKHNLPIDQINVVRIQEKKMKRYSITLDEKVHELLMALAKDNKCNQGQIIGRLLADLIKKEKENE